MADKYRFYNVSKANSEIERLEALVADRDTALAAAQEEITTLKGAAPKLLITETELAQLRADLVTAKQTIGSLEQTVESQKTEIATTKASVDKAAADKALQIVAAQGVKPVLNVPTDAPAKEAPKAKGLKGRDRFLAGCAACFPATTATK